MNIQVLSDQFRSKGWRLNNLYKIIDKNQKVIDFRMNWGQQEFYDGLTHRNLILKSRQLGFTTLIQLDMLDSALFNSNFTGGVIAHSKEDAGYFFRDKFKFPYENLPDGLKQTRALASDSQTFMEFNNGSSVRVGTSMRSGTVSHLHVSEFGKICAKFPQKAREIVTGAFNAVPLDGRIDVESTAEGSSGEFIDMAKTALHKQRAGDELTPLDFKFFFFPWWREPAYRLPQKIEPLKAQLDYFNALESGQDIILDEGQKAWYCKMQETQREDMLKEYPSYPEEALNASIVGAIYAQQMASVAAQKRICRVPYDRSVPVNTYWDLGSRDQNSIWFEQRLGSEHHFLHYYENQFQQIPHYVEYMRGLGYTFGKHILPHDGANTSLLGKSAKQQLIDLGFAKDTDIIVLPRPKDDMEIKTLIDLTRRMMDYCYFDAAGTERGVEVLTAYRREWSDRLQTFSEKPLHDWASNGADAFRAWATYVNMGSATGGIDLKRFYARQR